MVIQRISSLLCANIKYFGVGLSAVGAWYVIFTSNLLNGVVWSVAL
jgi:hypothetical protein